MRHTKQHTMRHTRTAHAHRLPLLPTLALLLTAGLLAGCPAPQQTGTVGPDPEQIEPVRIVEQAAGNDSALGDPMVQLVSNQAQLDALGADIPLAGDIDFEQHDLIVAALGQQNTAGYWVKITSAQRVGDTLYVEGVANAPAEDEMAAQQITHPYAAAIVPKTGARIALSDLQSVQGRDPSEFPVDDVPAATQPAEDDAAGESAQTQPSE